MKLKVAVNENLNKTSEACLNGNNTNATTNMSNSESTTQIFHEQTIIQHS